MSWYTELVRGVREQERGAEERVTDGDARKLTAFLDLTLEMAFLVEKILETEVGLVHVVSGIGGSLFMGAGGGVGIAIEGFQTGKEGACADVDGCGVVVRGGGIGRQVTEGVDDLLRGGLHDRVRNGAGRTGGWVGRALDRDLIAQSSSKLCSPR
jgi:hypothetical protein